MKKRVKILIAGSLLASLPLSVHAQPGNRGGLEEESAFVLGALNGVEEPEIREKVLKIYRGYFSEFLKDVDEQAVQAKHREKRELAGLLRDQFRECAERIADYYHRNDEERDDEGRDRERRRDITEDEDFQKWVAYKKLEYKSLIQGRKIYQLVRSKKTDTTKLAELEKQLRKSLNDLFEMRMKNEVRQIEELENELEELRRVHKKRMEKRDMIIEKRYNDVTGNDAIYDW